MVGPNHAAVKYRQFIFVFLYCYGVLPVSQGGSCDGPLPWDGGDGTEGARSIRRLLPFGEHSTDSTA